MGTYSLAEGARLLGVSASTLSRKLPAARVTQGRRAGLSADELVAVAPAVGADPEVVRRRGRGGAARAAAAEWLAELAARLEAEDRRALPVEALRFEFEPPAEVDWAAEPRGPAAEPVRSQAELEALAPPAG